VILKPSSENKELLEYALPEILRQSRQWQRIYKAISIGIDHDNSATYRGSTLSGYFVAHVTAHASTDRHFDRKLKGGFGEREFVERRVWATENQMVPLIVYPAPFILANLPRGVDRRPDKSHTIPTTHRRLSV